MPGIYSYITFLYCGGETEAQSRLYNSAQIVDTKYNTGSECVVLLAIVSEWRHMASMTLGNADSGNRVLPDGTKQLHDNIAQSYKQKQTYILKLTQN